MTSRLAYFEWSAPDDAAADDPEAWAEANPALGIRISPDAIRTELGALEPDDFLRERLGIFPEDVRAVDPAIDPAAWSECATDDASTLTPPAYAFEVSIDRKWACIALASGTTAGRVLIDLGENRQGTGWVVDRLVELRDTHSPIAIVCNPAGPAGALLPKCEKAGLAIGVPTPDGKGGVKVVPVTGRDYAQACGAAFDAVTQRQWRHLDQPALNTAVGGAAKRTVGDAWVFDRRGSVDISPWVAATLAGWALAKATEALDTEPFVIVT